jgi:hypothetical protein
VVLVALATAPAAHAFIYWANDGLGDTGTTLGRAELNSTGVNQSFRTGASGPCGVAVDGTYIYWANAAAGTIGRADLNGSNPNQSFVSGANNPCGVAVDGTHIYWANVLGGTIGRADLDGLNPNQSFVTGANSPCFVAVNATHIYWGNTSAVGRVDLDGTSNKDANFIPVGGNVCGVALDSAHVYWARNASPSAIGRADLAGTNPEPTFIPGGDNNCGIAIDGAHIYWAKNATGGAIGRANLDSSGVEQSFISAPYSCGVAVNSLASLFPPTGSPKTPNIVSPDAVASVSRLRIAPDAFAAAEKGKAIATRKRRPVGTRVSYRDSQAAVTTFTIQKPTRGVKRGKRCLKRTARRRTGRRCTRYVPKGSFRHRDRAGANSFRFTGRVLAAKLRPGRYRLRAVPRLNDRNGKARTKRFRIIP